MSNETTGGFTSLQVPQAEGVIPRTGKSKLTVRRDDDIRNKVAVSVKGLLGETIRVLITSQLPDDDGLVCVTKKNTK